MIDFHSISARDLPSLRCPDCCIPLVDNTEMGFKAFCPSCSFVIYFYSAHTEPTRIAYWLNWRYFSFNFLSHDFEVSYSFEGERTHLGTVSSIDLETINRLQKLLLLR